MVDESMYETVYDNFIYGCRIKQCLVDMLTSWNFKSRDVWFCITSPDSFLPLKFVYSLPFHSSLSSLEIKIAKLEIICKGEKSLEVYHVLNSSTITVPTKGR